MLPRDVNNAKYVIKLQLASEIRLDETSYLQTNSKLKYNFVETPHKFIIAELSIRKLGSSSVLSSLLATKS